MEKEDINLINFLLISTYFIVNILFLITGETCFKELVIVETAFIPFLYLLFYVIGRLVKKDIL